MVDDHSSDKTLKICEEIAQTDKRIQIFVNIKKGAQSAKNMAFKKSNGTLILFMDSDDLISPDHLQSHVKMADADTVTFCNMIEIGKFPEKRPIDKNYDNPIEIISDIWITGYFNIPSCWIVPREIVKITGGWNEELIKNQDGEYYCRILSNTKKLIFVPNAVTYWRIRNKSTSHTYSKPSMCSQLKSYMIMASIVHSRINCEKFKMALGCLIGTWMISFYPKNSSLLKEAKNITKQFECKPIIKFHGKMFQLIRPLLGWKLSKSIIVNRFHQQVYKKVKKF